MMQILTGLCPTLEPAPWPMMGKTIRIAEMEKRFSTLVTDGMAMSVDQINFRAPDVRMKADVVEATAIQAH